nr:unnamed protein product [Callosobruchus analis]
MPWPLSPPARGTTAAPHRRQSFARIPLRRCSDIVVSFASLRLVAKRDSWIVARFSRGARSVVSCVHVSLRPICVPRNCWMLQNTPLLVSISRVLLLNLLRMCRGGSVVILNKVVQMVFLENHYRRYVMND